MSSRKSRASKRKLTEEAANEPTNVDARRESDVTNNTAASATPVIEGGSGEADSGNRVLGSGSTAADSGMDSGATAANHGSTNTPKLPPGDESDVRVTVKNQNIDGNAASDTEDTKRRRLKLKRIPTIALTALQPVST